MDRTLILVKPDAFARGLTGEILARFERKGLTIVALEKQHISRETAELNCCAVIPKRASADRSGSSATM